MWSDYFSEVGGRLYRRHNSGTRWFTGQEAGTLEATGYVRVKVGGKLRRRHQIVWEMHHGPIPTGMRVDHIDSTPGNDWVGNLQLVTQSGNMALGTHKLTARNKSGYNGVSWAAASHMWEACCRYEGRKVYLGLHSTAELAHVAVVAYKAANNMPQSRRHHV